MPSLTPTPEQQAVITHAVNSPSNLLVEARAGAAKTSTLVMLASALPPATRGLALAFNKSIQLEMQDRLPSTFTCKTLNGLGHGAISKYLGRRLKLIKSKSYGILKDQIAELEKLDQDEAYEELGVTLRIIAKGKQLGYVPGEKRSLYDEGDFLAAIAEIPSDLQLHLVNQVLRVSWDQLTKGTIDFDDQILGAALLPVSFDTYTHVLVDETQDLSILQHRILKKIVRKRTKLIAVGDPCQAIYGFRGADEDSMEKLADTFEADTLSLTTCFRCAQAVIKAAQWRAPDMAWPSWAVEGEVRTLDTWSPADIEDGAAILCRNNAPLFRTAIRLLKANRYPEIMGRDIAANLSKRLKSLGPLGMDRDAALQQVKAWLSMEREKNKDQSLNEDIAACMAIFIEQADTLRDAITLVENLAERKGRIKLATGHRAKGLEWDNVYFLDQDLCSPKGQDRNIKYVIQTRAAKRLTYITTDGFTTVAIPEEAAE